MYSIAHTSSGSTNREAAVSSLATRGGISTSPNSSFNRSSRPRHCSPRTGEVSLTTVGNLVSQRVQGLKVFSEHVRRYLVGGDSADLKLGFERRPIEAGKPCSHAESKTLALEQVTRELDKRFLLGEARLVQDFLRNGDSHA
jgi:hypothetical protein